MQISYTDSLEKVPADAWNAVSGIDNPFVRHEFLVALERHDCLHPYGWQPIHVLVHDNHQLVGALPLYIKTNSRGEFVFDWAWADAYERMMGKNYYPKLVCSVPYTPVTGPRLLIAPHVERASVAAALTGGAQAVAKKLQVSSLHYLFSNEIDTPFLRQQPGLMARMGYQFHWDNRGYSDFADYLDRFKSKKRQQIRRERRDAQSCGATIEMLDGYQATAEHWAIFHDFYSSTFLRKFNVPALSLNFFKAIAKSMPEAIVLVMAHLDGRYVAGAFNLRGTDTLYGRYWGCGEHFRHLHFEVCYYQTLEFCIEYGLQRFEAGAQGEHKISRGFLPKATWSVHWLAQPAFALVINQFIDQETVAIHEYIEELKTHSPFKGKGGRARIKQD